MQSEDIPEGVSSKVERTLSGGFSEVHRLIETLELPEPICDQACQLFRRAQSEDMLVGRSTETMAAASVYGACRCNGLAQTPDNIIDVSPGEHSVLMNAYRALNTELGLPTQTIAPSAHIPRIASKLNLTDQTRQRAQELADATEFTAVTTGIRPSGFAAACVYKAIREGEREYTQAEVADVANVSTGTITTHLQTINECMK